MYPPLFVEKTTLFFELSWHLCLKSSMSGFVSRSSFPSTDLFVYAYAYATLFEIVVLY